MLYSHATKYRLPNALLLDAWQGKGKEISMKTASIQVNVIRRLSEVPYWKGCQSLYGRVRQTPSDNWVQSHCTADVEAAEFYGSAPQVSTELAGYNSDNSKI